MMRFIALPIKVFYIKTENKLSQHHVHGGNQVKIIFEFEKIGRTYMDKSMKFTYII